MANASKIKTFTDLNAWKVAYRLTIEVYEITKKFPSDELFSLTNQIRRSAISITSNLAEGFGRSGMKEKIQFYYIALGSVNELQNQLIIAKGLDYVPETEFSKIWETSIDVQKLINGLIKSIKNYK